MRGGALAPFAWALILATFGVINAIWTGDAVHMALFGFGVLATLTFVSGLRVASPQATRPGPPAPDPTPEALPTGSAATVGAAVGFGGMVFGFAFGEFPILFGAGVMIASLGRLLGERTAQRRAVRAAQGLQPAARPEAAEQLEPAGSR